MISVSMFVIEFDFAGQCRTAIKRTLPEVLELLKSAYHMIDQSSDRVTVEVVLAVDSQRIGIANQVIKLPIFYGGQPMIERVLDNPDLLIRLD